MRTALQALALAVVLFSIAPASAAPPHWTCPESYSHDSYCDCGCGNYDPDCADLSKPYYDNCPGTYDCRTDADPEGDYTCGAKPNGVPAGWTCAGTWYDSDSYCDCGCGEVDPDCSDPSAIFYCANGSGTSCSPEGTCQTVQAASATTIPPQVINILHVGGMCSTHFNETASSKLNNTVYKVRLAGVGVSGQKIDAWIDEKTVSTVPGTYNQMKSYLDQYCTGSNSCWIYSYSAGTAVVGYALASVPNPSQYHVLGHRAAAGADGGSPLADWGDLARLFACPMAPNLKVSTMMNLYNHNNEGNLGITTYRSGGKGHSAWWPWGWSAHYLWAGSAFIGGEDDGAVGLSSSFGCNTSGSRNNLSTCVKYTGNTCATAGCPIQGLDHYELKVRPMIEAGW